MDWLTTTLQASLRDEALHTDGFRLQIISTDPETVVIYVRYMPDANQRAMKMSIQTAHKFIDDTAKNYGWDKWVKVQEDVQPAKPDSQAEPK
jgi:hypothetical protein